MSFPGLSLNPGNVVGKALKRSDEKKNWPLDVAKVPIRKSSAKGFGGGIVLILFDANSVLGHRRLLDRAV